MPETPRKQHFDPPGLQFFDARSERWMKYVYPDTEGSYAGWILYKHPDGQWVTLRKATDDDLERMSKAVSKAHHQELP